MENIEQKAKELKAQFGDNAKYVVCEIVEALKITTGHCELRKLEWHEVQQDFKFWKKVKKYLENIPI